MNAKPKRPLRFLSVCSGIEAASQALHRHGFECAAVSEIEPHPCAVLAHRFGASRPWNMPDPDALGISAKDRTARKNAIKAIAKIPSGNQIPNFGDMSRFQEWPDAEYDALFGGTPCQSFSIAGLRAGLDDPRGNLMLTYGAIAARYRPRWICWENVTGVLSSDGGRDFASLLGLLTGREVIPPPEGWQNSGIVPGIADAYGIAWRVLDAQYSRTLRFRRAVPQRRRRVFLVGYLGDWRRAAAVLFDRESLRGDPPPRREEGKGVAATTDGRAAGGGKSSAEGNARPDHHSDHSQRDGAARIAACEEVAPTISARPTGGAGMGTDFDLDGGLIASEVAATLDASYGRLQGTSGQDANHGHSTLIAMSSGQANAEITEGHAPALTCLHEAPIVVVQAVAHTLRSEGHDASEDGTGKGTPIIAIQERAVSENPNAGPDGIGVNTEGAAYTLEARTQVQAVAFDPTQITSPANRSNPQPGDPCHTLAKGAHAPAIATPWAVRRLTPRECERLMGMEDDFTNIPWRGRPSSPDANRYKELGNSWALNSIDWIGERMVIVDSWDD